MIDNSGKGLEVRTSRNTVVIANQLLGNGSAGLFIGNQPNPTMTLVRDNVFTANRVGLSTVTASSLSLSGNNFLNQFPRFLQGDLAIESEKIMEDLRGSHPIELVASGVEGLSLAPPICPSWTEG